MNLSTRTVFFALAAAALAACGPQTTRVTVSATQALSSQTNPAIETSLRLDLWSALDADARDYSDAEVKSVRLGVAKVGDGNKAKRLTGKLFAQTMSSTPVELGAFDLEIREGHSVLVPLGLIATEEANRAILREQGAFGFVLSANADSTPAAFDAKLDVEVDAIYAAE